MNYYTFMHTHTHTHIHIQTRTRTCRQLNNFSCTQSFITASLHTQFNARLVLKNAEVFENLNNGSLKIFKNQK